MGSQMIRAVPYLLSVFVLSVWPQKTDQGVQDPFRAVRRLTIEHHGRLVSFDAFCRQIWWTMSGSPVRPGDDVVAVVMSIMADPVSWKTRPLLPVRSMELRQALGLRPETELISCDALSKNRTFRTLRRTVARKRRRGTLSHLDRELWNLRGRLTAFQMMTDQELRLVPAPSRGAERLPVLRPDAYFWQEQIEIKRIWSALILAIRSGDTTEIDLAGKHFARVIQDLEAIAHRPSIRIASLAPWTLIEIMLAALVVLVFIRQPRWHRKAKPVHSFSAPAWETEEAHSLDALEPYRMAIQQRAPNLCWDHRFGHGTPDHDAAICRINRFLPELATLARDVGPGDAQRFETSGE